MYKLILVEDETLVRRGMEKNTPWGQYGFELVAACQDGREAIAQVQRLNPDVVITDICMPFVNGIEVASYLKKQFPNIVVIILTGYSEFNYAHTALKLHVYDFLLKPILPKELATLLTGLKSELDQRTMQKRRVSDLQQRARQAATYLRDTLYHRILHSEAGEDEILALTAQTQTVFQGAAQCVLLAEVYPRVGSAAPPSGDRLQLLAAKLAVLTDKYRVVTIDDQYIMAVVGDSTQVRAIERARKLGEELMRIGDDIGVVLVGVGDAVTNLGHLHRSSQQALHALGYGFTANGRVVLDCLARDAEGRLGRQEVRARESELLRALQQKNDRDAERYLLRLFDLFVEKGLHRDVCIPILGRLMVKLEDLSPVEAQQNLRAIRPSCLWSNVEQVKQMFLQTLELLRQDGAKLQGSTAEQCVEQAKVYMQRRCTDSQFALAEVLEYLSVSKSYFSAAFKEQTGQTFTEYLTNLRMERAKVLLRTTDLYTNEISEKIGFLDANYFSTTFKRCVGVTPKRYREETQ